MIESKADEYLYVINYPIIEESLCRMEMRYLFHKEVTGKHLFSRIKIIPSRSPFIKHCMSLLFSADTLEELMFLLESNRVAYRDFKFVHFKIDEGELGYEEWISAVTALGTVIDGEVDMENPKVTLGAAKVNGRWMFGEYEQNDYKWKEHDNKPNTNSHSLGLKTARALVNIAAGDDRKCSMVDPCCGVGTVVIEASSMGLDIKAYEINRIIAEKAKENLAFFGYTGLVTTADMHGIEERFDVSIVDIPYGLFTPITPEEQVDIIKTARRISGRMVIITFEDMDGAIADAGFEVIDRCHVCKGKFKRYISVCR